MSAFPENIPLCFFPTHCFITAGHFPMLSWRDQHGCIDIHLFLSFMKGKSFTSGKKRHCLFPIRFVPPPFPLTVSPPRCRLFTFIVGRGNGCLCAPLCKCDCMFEVGRMKASSSVWAQQQVGWCVGLCLYLSGKRTVRTCCVLVYVCARSYLLMQHTDGLQVALQSGMHVLDCFEVSSNTILLFNAVR